MVTEKHTIKEHTIKGNVQDVKNKTEKKPQDTPREDVKEPVRETKETPKPPSDTDKNCETIEAIKEIRASLIPFEYLRMPITYDKVYAKIDALIEKLKDNGEKE